MTEPPWIYSSARHLIQHKIEPYKHFKRSNKNSQHSQSVMKIFRLFRIYLGFPLKHLSSDIILVYLVYKSENILIST